MQASARNRDAFAGSSAEDQPEQQTVWRKADPGIKGSVTALIEGPALAAFEVVHHSLRDHKADAPVVRVAHDGFAVWIEALQIADAQAAAQHAVGEIAVELEPVCLLYTSPSPRDS